MRVGGIERACSAQAVIYSTQKLMTKPLILVVNDDGIYAPGITALGSVLYTMADVLVVAPENDCSAVGHSTTFEEPLRMRKVTLPFAQEAYACSGKPVDCVRIALAEFFKDRPIDMVVSGINNGPNLAGSVFYSGTVAAAREAVRHGLPGIAFSLDGGEDKDEHFQKTLPYIKKIMRAVIAKGLPKGMGLNVNFPEPGKAYKELKVCPQGDSLITNTSTMLSDKGRIAYCSLHERAYAPIPGQEAPWNDEHLATEGHITIVPFDLDVTATQQLDYCQALLS